MRKFDKRIQIGTKVLIDNLGWFTVTGIHETRKWLKVDGLCGEFPYYDVLKFSNILPKRKD